MGPSPSIHHYCLLHQTKPGATPNLERVMGIEPTSSAWKAEVLPLNYTRLTQSFTTVNRRPVGQRFPHYLWWRGEDLNLRRLSRQIYSLIPLTTREPLQNASPLFCFSNRRLSTQLRLLSQRNQLLHYPEGPGRPLWHARGITDSRRYKRHKPGNTGSKRPGSHPLRDISTCLLKRYRKPPGERQRYFR